jgi:hypothetical protein
MKLLISATILIALTIALGSPSTSEARVAKSKVKRTTASHLYVRQARPTTVRTVVRPCAARVSYIGCLGWDPDPNVRSMIQMDSGLYDY